LTIIIRFCILIIIMITVNNKINHKSNVRLRQSRQRTRILELLKSTTIHPTADWLYEQLKKEFPKLSLGTIYRNLSILSEQGLVKKIHFGSTFDRFEAQMAPHYHLVCENCNSILDFHMPIYDELNSKAKELTEFNIQYHRIDFYGLCKNCATK
jgi:Fur family transcriptional regulator, peroxide stress response regulator